MDQNIPSSRSSGDALLDGLSRSLEMDWPGILSVENRLRRQLPLIENHPLSRRYFYLYTVPILEGARLLDDKRRTCEMWAAIQISLGLHLRYIDHVLDSDEPADSKATCARRAYRFLAHAQELLRSHGMAWGFDQAALYGQFYEYESEVEQGFFHDFSSVWRRVSPLCVVPETYLARRLSSEFPRCYRRFLSWSLLKADCDDTLKDLRNRCTTPVTRLVLERISGVHRDFAAVAEVITGINDILQRHYEILLRDTGNYPMWQEILIQMNRAFEH